MLTNQDIANLSVRFRSVITVFDTPFLETLIETIISTADLRANDTLAGWLGQDLTVTGVSRWERSLYV